MAADLDDELAAQRGDTGDCIEQARADRRNAGIAGFEGDIAAGHRVGEGALAALEAGAGIGEKGEAFSDAALAAFNRDGIDDNQTGAAGFRVGGDGGFAGGERGGLGVGAGGGADQGGDAVTHFQTHPGKAGAGEGRLHLAFPAGRAAEGERSGGDGEELAVIEFVEAFGERHAVRRIGGSGLGRGHAGRRRITRAKQRQNQDGGAKCTRADRKHVSSHSQGTGEPAINPRPCKP